MILWITQNIGTILITLFIAIIVTLIILSMIRDKKQGRSSCGGNCAHCNMCASCKMNLGDGVIGSKNEPQTPSLGVMRNV